MCFCVPTLRITSIGCAYKTGGSKNGKPRHAEEYAYWLTCNKSFIDTARHFKRHRNTILNWKNQEDWEGCAKAQAVELIDKHLSYADGYYNILDALTNKLIEFIGAYEIKDGREALDIVRLLANEINAGRPLRIEQEITTNRDEDLSAVIRANPHLIDLCQRFQDELTEQVVAGEPGNNGGPPDALLD